MKKKNQKELKKLKLNKMEIVSFNQLKLITGGFVSTGDTGEDGKPTIRTFN